MILICLCFEINVYSNNFESRVCHGQIKLAKTDVMESNNQRNFSENALMLLYSVYVLFILKKRKQT